MSPVLFHCNTNNTTNGLVPVAPSVQVPSQLLGAPLGSEVQLQCLVEASPGPVFYWLKGGKSPTNLEAGQPKSEMLLDG